MNEDQLTPEQIQEQRQAIWDELEQEDNGEAPKAEAETQQVQATATQSSNEPAAEPAADASGAGETKPAAAPAETPDKVAVLEQTVTSLMNRLRATEGHIGNLNSVIKTLRETAPKGGAPSAEQMKQAAGDSEAMAKMLEDYPELGATFKKVLEGREAAMRSQIEELLAKNKPEGLVSREDVDQMRKEFAVEVAHPGWSEKVKTPEFGAWLQAQPREVQLLAQSSDPQDAIRLLDLEKQARQPKPAQDKTQRLASAAAVQTQRSASSIRSKPVEEMTPQEYWEHLAAQERRQESARA